MQTYILFMQPKIFRFSLWKNCLKINWLCRRTWFFQQYRHLRIVSTIAQMKKIYLIIFLLTCIGYKSESQCATGGAVWLNGQNDGIKQDTGLIAGSVLVYANTVGTMTSGRPLYRISSSTWKGLNYAALQVWRAYSLPGSNYTSFKLTTPLDSSRMHLRVDNIRGDFINWETQLIKGFNNGVAVPIDFKDPVNGAYITGGNTINGGAGTTTAVQSAMRAFFRSPVDSIVIQQVSFSDWIIAELMIECDYLLSQSLVSFTATETNSMVKLKWKTGTESINLESISVERSADGRNWTTLSNIHASGSWSSYSSDDQNPLSGINFYRLRYIYSDGRSEYSAIIRINRVYKGPLILEIYPNPVRDNLLINLNASVLKARIFDGLGHTLATLNTFAGTQQVNCSQWPSGTYYLRVEMKNGEIITRKIFRQ
jgi:hypothetical protein